MIMMKIKKFEVNYLNYNYYIYKYLYILTL